jgi:hypothetical protein
VGILTGSDQALTDPFSWLGGDGRWRKCRVPLRSERTEDCMAISLYLRKRVKAIDELYGIVHDMLF